MQVGSKRGRSPEAEPAARLMVDAEGKPRKRLRTSYPSPQFLTVYNHRQTLKQRCLPPLSELLAVCDAVWRECGGTGSAVCAAARLAGGRRWLLHRGCQGYAWQLLMR